MRSAIGLLLRVFSYLFEGILSLFLIGLAVVADSTGHPLTLGMLPWEGAQVNHWVLGLGLVGLVIVVLTIVGFLRFLLPLWALFVFIMMLRGFFLTGYNFGGEEAFRGAAWLTFGAFGAFLSSLAVFDKRRSGRS